MLIKTNLLFRECKPYVNSDGEKFLRLRFLDDNDDSFTFFVPDDNNHDKFKSMKKDSSTDITLNLYKSNKGKYNMYANF